MLRGFSLHQSIWFMAVVCLAMGCRSRNQVYDARYHQLSKDFAHAKQMDSESAIAPVADDYIGSQSVDDYVRLGLKQNPRIQEARLRVESLANRVPQAASLPDPLLGATVFPAPIQTAAGEQEFALSMNQKFPWRGKLATRAAVAEQEVNAARARLAAVELQVAEQIKSAYFQLYLIQQTIAITESDKLQLEAIETIVENMYLVKQEVTQQDFLQVQIEISRIETDLVNLRQQQKSAQARLARLLHISPETDLQAVDELPTQQLTGDIEYFYQRAIECRPELHAQLSAIQRNRIATRLAELDRYPDLTLGFNWIATATDGISPVANGDDSLVLTLGMNLPIYKKRIEHGVREAKTRALAEARGYDALKDETVESVADLFAKALSLQETLSLFRDDIIPKSQLTLEQSIDDYQVGKVDFLQMIDNWRQVLRYQIAEKRFETELHKSFASLARLIGCFDLSSADEIFEPQAPPEITEQEPDDINVPNGN